MPFVTTKDQTEIYYKDWGNPTGPVIVFSHGWPLNSDNWENQMFFMGNHGFRCVAHDRRGHGRSSQPWGGNEMDTYSDDLLEVFKHLNLKNVMLVGHSTGCAEVIRFCARHAHGTDLVDKAVLVGGMPPVMLLKGSNPDGLPIEVFDSFRSGMTTDRAQYFLDVPSGPFFGYNRPGAKASQGLIQSWYQQAMMCGFKNAYDCITAFSETDLTEDMKILDIPVLLLHGDDDQLVPIADSALKGIKLLKKGTLKIYPGGAHALPNTAVDEVNQDLLDFAKS